MVIGITPGQDVDIRALGTALSEKYGIPVRVVIEEAVSVGAETVAADTQLQLSDVKEFHDKRTAPHPRRRPLVVLFFYSTVTLLARFRGLSMSQPRSKAI